MLFFFKGRGVKKKGERKKKKDTSSAFTEAELRIVSKSAESLKLLASAKFIITNHPTRKSQPRIH